MEDYVTMRSRVPAFGSWDSREYLPFTECFESARQAGLLRYTTYLDEEDDEDEGDHSGDLYVTGDLYQNDVVTPAVIVVPRSRPQSRRSAADAKQFEKQSGLEAADQRIAPLPVRVAKPVDEDLYQISPELLRHNVKKKRGLGFFVSCCLVPTCFM
uniref:Uncharacterized protein n=1 Tax=Kalanchoe fedtschenkoi TaxID=63787 RepID=A0A7N0UHA0_KALFE